jgi:hypothetical protein
MKPRLIAPLAAFTLAAVAAARADLVMITDTAAGEVTSRTTLSISGDLVRTDNGTETSVILDTKAGRMTTLMHEQKMLMTMDLKQLQAAVAATPGAPGTTGANATKVTATGKFETVQGHRCEIYTSENAGTVVTMWIAKNYPDYDKLKSQLNTFEKLNPTAKQPEMPGLALKTEFTTSGIKFVTSLVSLKEQKVDPAVFKVPGDYKALGQ